MLEDRCAIVVFGKEPVPGRVKTRLVPPLTDHEAADLYAAFFRDTVELLSGLPATTRLYLPAGERCPADLLPVDPTPFEQSGIGLGERMRAAFLETFAAGFGRVVIFGSDHPTLPDAYLQLALEELRTPRRVVVGPSSDGGFYLLGMNDLYTGLFEGMTYSHERVLADTLDRAGELQADVTILPEWYDVDSYDDLARLAADLDGSSEGANHTRLAMAALRSAQPSLL